MAEYIRKEQGKKIAETARKRVCALLESITELCEITDSIPAADVAEVRHGHWETDKDGRKNCSACGAWCICMRKDGLWIDKTPYCPCCGAKMDESEGEDNV